MIVLDTFGKEINEERLLSRLPGDSADMYEDDVDDLLEQIREEDVLHPAAAYTRVELTGAETDQIQAEGAVMTSSVFTDKCKAGDIVYPCLVTVGRQLDQFTQDLDDPMLSYLQGLLMNLCLDDALLAVAQQIAEHHPDKKLLMVKPGVDGVCEFSEQSVLLKWLGDATDKLGVTVSDRGFLTPGYSSTALLFVTDEPSNYCQDWQDESQRAALLADLNKIAGHI